MLRIVQQGQVWWVDQRVLFYPDMGRGLKGEKNRPVAVVSGPVLNQQRRFEVSWVVPFSTRVDLATPLDVVLQTPSAASGLTGPSMARVALLQPCRYDDLLKLCGRLSDHELNNLLKLVAEILGFLP